MGRFNITMELVFNEEVFAIERFVSDPLLLIIVTPPPIITYVHPEIVIIDVPFTVTVTSTYDPGN